MVVLEPAEWSRYTGAVKLLSLVILTLLAVAGCEKGPATDASHVKLSADESAMLASLPGGNVALFGGNYLRFQKYLSDSALNQMMGKVMESAGPGMTEWMNCYVELKNVKMLSGVKLDGSLIEMRFMMKGIDLAQIEGCAKRAAFPSTMDADHKFFAMEMPSQFGPVKGGYLALGDGTVYSRMTMQFPAMTPTAVDRAGLEADIASIAKVGSAASDKVLVSQLGAVDRSKAIWFVGSAAGTPIADKVGTAHGTFDFGDGFSCDVTAQIVDKQLAAEITEGVPEAKKQAGALGGAMKSFIEKLKFNRKGDQFHFQIATSEAEMKALVEQVSQFAPK